MLLESTRGEVGLFLRLMNSFVFLMSERWLISVDFNYSWVELPGLPDLIRSLGLILTLFLCMLYTLGIGGTSVEL